MKKAELRRLYLDKRSSLSPAAVATASEQIAQRYFNEIDHRRVKRLHTFIRIPILNEFDTSNIYFRLWQERFEVETYPPRINAESGEIESIEFDSDTPMFENAWGIREPEGKEKAEPEEFDLVIVPLLCFDLAGHRVGYGKGFYDRFLARCRTDCLKLGVSLFPPVEAIEDVHSGDIRLDICITPDRKYRFREDSEYLN